MNKFKVFVLFISFLSLNFFASSNIKLNEISVNIDDIKSIKRGARIFFDYCQGCHSLKYMRYADLGAKVKLGDPERSFEELVREYFLHSVDGIKENSPILSSMNKEYGVKWFGKVPPDLSLVARYRGTAWLYTYMQSFYKDSSKQWGVNNLVFPDVAMPHVLVGLQGVQVLRDSPKGDPSYPQNMLYLTENGLLSTDQYFFCVKDLVTFLAYVGEPNKTDRENIGFYVLIYFVIMSVILFFIKRTYWKDVE